MRITMNIEGLAFIKAKMRKLNRKSFRAWVRRQELLGLGTTRVVYGYKEVAIKLELWDRYRLRYCHYNNQEARNHRSLESNRHHAIVYYNSPKHRALLMERVDPCFGDTEDEIFGVKVSAKDEKVLNMKYGENAWFNMGRRKSGKLVCLDYPY